jgi:predicted regulator of Ras-like GTPase activity (Roadblock/LC7/MglB family)
MPFKSVLGRIVDSVRGAVGAILVDDEGESVDVFTRGDGYEIRLAGAHHGIVLALLDEAMKRSENGDSLQGLSIKSERLIYTIMPVQEGLFVVLMQDETGIPSQGMKALKDAVPEIAALI